MNSLQSMVSYIFSPLPGSAFSYYTPFLIFAGLLIVGGIAFNVYYQAVKKDNLAIKTSLRTLSRNLIILGIVFLILLGARYENISFFSMRLFLGLAILAVFFTLYRAFVKYSRTKKEHSTKTVTKTTKSKESKKYLPNKPRK